MAIRKIFLEKGPNRNHAFTVRKSGLAWGAKFVQDNSLEGKNYLVFLEDDENPYWLGFRFEDSAQDGALKLGTNKDSSNVFHKAQELFSRNPVLRKVREEQTTKSSAGVFSIHEDKKNNCFYVNLRPCFENSIERSDINHIPAGCTGIYRYIDGNEVVYIGEGVIRERTKEPSRKGWKADRIEYSIIEDKTSCQHWESHYIAEFQNRHGRLPYYNAIAGRKSTSSDS